MKSVFADTLYWLACLRPSDQWHWAAQRARSRLGDITLVTTDEFLAEFLTALSRGGRSLRRSAVLMVREIMSDERVEVIPQCHEGFVAALNLYDRRDDKTYSLIECVSMNVKRARNVSEVLTKDRHFEQEGFTVLIS